MPALVIKDMPEELHRKLKERAQNNRRSMTKEALVLLETALGWDSPDHVEPPIPFRGTFRIDDDWIANAKKEGRA